MKPGGDLYEELRPHRNVELKSEADAKAICGVLSSLTPAQSDSIISSPLHSLINFFQQVESTNCPAFKIMARQGTTILVRIVDDTLEQRQPWNEDDVLFALKMLAMYGTKSGTEAVIRAARRRLKPDGFMWSVVLRPYSEGHPHSELLFQALDDPLPTGFLAVSLLDAANAAQRNEASFPHPFDSPAGRQQIKRWLVDTDEAQFSCAVSATVAIPFLTGPEQDSLLASAFDHLSKDVQLEAAWVAGKMGREAGIRCLARMCLDIAVAEKARIYLEELGRSDAIPDEAEDDSFQAKAQFSIWLAHPSELGRAPDELEIIDHRVLHWPPEFEPKPMWLIKYRATNPTQGEPDDVGVGLVGSMTFCFFSYKLEQRPPEDGYAIHCYWELQHRNLMAEIEVEEGSTEYDSMFTQYAAEPLVDGRIVLVVEPSHDLNYPQRLIGLAKGRQDGKSGWLVLDGPRTHWYSTDEMPSETSDGTIMMVHAGRVLLGFQSEPDRHNYLQPPTTSES